MQPDYLFMVAAAAQGEGQIPGTRVVAGQPAVRVGNIFTDGGAVMPRCENWAAYNNTPTDDVCAANKMAEDNIRLVYKFVKQNSLYLIDADELLSLASLAFLRATRLYNEGHASGAKFSTFAYKFMRSALLSTMKQRRRSRERLRDARSFSHLDQDKLGELLAGHKSAGDIVCDAETVETCLSVGLAVLNERELSMFVQRYGNDEILDDISDGVSRERCRQIVKLAMRKVRGRISLWRNSPVEERNKLPRVDVKDVLNRYAGKKKGLKGHNGNATTGRKRQGTGRKDGHHPTARRGRTGGKG